MDEEERKRTKKNIYAGLAICLSIFLVFTIGFETGSKKGFYEGELSSQNKAFDEGYDACLTPILDAAYSAEGDNLVSLRTDKWKNPAKKQIVVLQCSVVQEIGDNSE